MSRSLNNRRYFLLLSALTAALLWLAPVRSAQAAVFIYNARQRTIKAGVLFVGTAADPTAPDPAPYVFRVLDRRLDVKPVGWSFINPLAQSTVTASMINRWAGAYAPGASLTPDMAAYWEVPLRDVSADDLQQFDVLYLSASGVGFLPADNEKLRRFVDNGGQLIVEYSAPAGFPLLFDSANWAAGTANTALSPPLVNSVFDLHPLITQPNLLQVNAPLSDLPYLGAPSAVGGYGTITQNTNIFSTVLTQGGSKDAVDAAQLGGGQIVTSALNIGPTVSISYGARFASGPFFAQAPYFNGAPSYSPSVVPAADLKLLSNIISWGDAHPNENKTSHQNAAGPSSASFTAAWAYPDPARNTPLAGGTAPPGAAVWGNYVYVTDSTGVLHAFDAVPDEFLTNQASADDGLADFSSPTPTPYDEVWNANVGANASAPTVASFNGATYVFVERANGSVVQFSAVNTVAGATPVKTLAALGSATFPQPNTPNAPAPTYYDGRIYAGQADGTVSVYSLNGTGSAASGANIPVDPQTGVPGETVTASPAVGLLEGGLVTNTIVAYVPTTQNMNTVLLGARNDPLTLYSPNGQFQGYNINRTARYGLFNLFADPATNPSGQAHDSSGNNVVALSGGRDPVYATTTPLINVDDIFGEWDVDFVNSIPQNGGQTLTLHEIKALSLANTTAGSTQATVSAPAIDRQGDYYYVVNDTANNNSYLFGIHDDIAQRNVLIKFRFRLPKTNDSSTVDPTSGLQWSTPANAVDADNVKYGDPTLNGNGATNSLLDFRFVGAPVVDSQGNVYVAAQGNQTLNGNATSVAAVLCFSANQEITAEAETPTQNPPPALTRNPNFDAIHSRYFQLDESTGNPQNPLVAIRSNGRGAARYGQITTAGSQATVFNFGRGSGGSRQIAGNLCEPQPFTAVPANPQNGSAATWMYFHTNMAWYATFNVNGQVSGLSKSGNTIFLCDSGNTSGSPSVAYNTLYKLPAAPTVGVGKVAALTVRRAPLGAGLGGTPLNIGTVAAAPSAGGGAMVINGTGGIAAFNQQLTLIADNNRILEVDADGGAVWSADATTRPGANGLTRVDFAHPAALSQFAPNDYLVADTGNNRCVRFDRGGNVIWELTRFYDPGGLMAPGQPFTLSHPSSVEVRHEVFNYKDPVSGSPLAGQLVHYLVADTGNDRIVEVTDTLDAAGNILYFDTNTPANVVAPGTANSVTHDHLLTWVTHTGDKYGRHYHYAGASYLDIPVIGNPDTVEVFALVTNARIAQPIAGSAFAPAGADAPGGSIAAFVRPLSPVPFAQITGATPNDLQYVATSFTALTPTGGTLIFPVRNPRFLHVSAPPQVPVANAASYLYNFLYADDNGVFDLNYTGQTTPPASYGLAFTQVDYRKMTTQYNIAADVPGNVPLRNGALASGSNPAIPPIPFVPTCVQRLNDDDTNKANLSHIDRYLITQSYSQGELARLPGLNIPTRLGGEIFEVDVSTAVGGTTTVVNTPVGGFAGAVTLSRPIGASPLTQPTFAIRTAQ